MRPAAAKARPGRRPRQASPHGERPAASRRGRAAPVAAPTPPAGDEAAVAAVTRDVLAVLAAFGLED